MASAEVRSPILFNRLTSNVKAVLLLPHLDLEDIGKGGSTQEVGDASEAQAQGRESQNLVQPCDLFRLQ